MEPLYWSSEYDNTTTLYPGMILAIVAIACAILVVRKRDIFIPIVLAVCFVPVAQRIVILSIDFTVLRLTLLVAVVRGIIRNELSTFKLTQMDKAFLIYLCVSFTVYSIQWHSLGSTVYRLGTSYDALGLYFVFRFYVSDKEDLLRIVGYFAFAAITTSGFFLIEKTTGRNLFSVFGGIPEVTVIRGGKLRCQGPYPHPIIAGSFWASLTPFFVAYAADKRQRVLGMLGLIGSTVIVVTTASSTPLFGLISSLVAMSLYPLRKRMRAILISALGLVAMLALVMKAPVWYLIARVPLVGGSDSYHRAELIDATIRHFGEWWLLGTKYTSHWGFMMYDLTNQYVAEAVRGGLIGLVAFIVVIASAYKNVGRMVSVAETLRMESFLPWTVGCALFVHLMQFTAVSYFGQIILCWYATLALSNVTLVPVLPRLGNRPHNMQKELGEDHAMFSKIP